MKPPKPIARKSEKLKRGQEFIYQGEHVWVERDPETGKVFITLVKDSKNIDDYIWVEKCELKPVNAARSIIKKVVKRVSTEEKKFRKDLNVFFASHTLTMPFICENCNQPLYAFNAFERRCTIAHILEKSKFKSVATHPQNKLFLCAKGGCHAKYDNSTAVERSQMPVHKLALERFEAFKEHLNDREIIRAYTYLNIEWE